MENERILFDLNSTTFCHALFLYIFHLEFQDVKFRSFVCAGLNARALDVWVDLIGRAAGLDSRLVFLLIFNEKKKN